jgi:peroxiredoxin
MFKKSFVLLFTAVLIFSTAIFSADNPSPKKPGEQVDDFTLKNYDGTPYTLSDLKNSRAVVVVFISTRCPFVQPYTDRLNDLSQEFSKQGITFLAINSNSTEDLQEVQSHALKNGYPFPVLKDENNIVADLFGATRTPEVFVLDPNRIILYHGRIDDNKDADQVTSSDLKNALDEITSGKEVAVKSTKQFGCGIKRVESDKPTK